MKATGIVRRIDDWVIIGQKFRSLKTPGFRWFCPLFSLESSCQISVNPDLGGRQQIWYAPPSFWGSIEYQATLSNLPRRLKVPSGFCHTVWRFSFSNHTSCNWFGIRLTMYNTSIGQRNNPAGLFYFNKEDSCTKCLRKYEWIKLPRDYPDMGKGLMPIQNHWQQRTG